MSRRNTPESGAVFSRCGRYRYSLWRRWSAGDTLLFIMLNPSTADADHDDPTIARCRRRAERLGFGGLEVVNLFALRSRDPRALYEAHDPVSPHNDRVLRARVRDAHRVLCGWGNHGRLGGRGRTVLARIQRLGVVPHALALTRFGEPAHPLYLSLHLEPEPICGVAPQDR